jgi:hypothetical protein
MIRRSLTNGHGYVELLRATQAVRSGSNLEWVTRFLAAGPRTRRRMLDKWHVENDRDVSNRDRHIKEAAR